ncbi:MAG TPA: hypothetical protein VGE98_00770 [Thermoanaerobaculia bacterium]
MTVKVIEVSDAIESLGTYVREQGSKPLVVMDGGRPVATLVSVENADLETIALSTDPEFLALIERSRARLREEGGLSSQEIRHRLMEEKE